MHGINKLVEGGGVKEINLGFREKERVKEQTENRWWEVGKGEGGTIGHTRVHELVENRTGNDEKPDDTNQQKMQICDFTSTLQCDD